MRSFIFTVAFVLLALINILKAQDELNSCLKYLDFHVVVLGSSTAEGQGPSNIENAWVNQYRSFLHGINPNNKVTNLAIGGTTTYHILPDWYPTPDNRPAVNSSNNVSKAIALGADAIIVNMPSNDTANGFTAQEQIDNFQTIATEAFDAGIQFWFCTSQPKTSFDPVDDLVQIEVRDFVLNFFGPFGIDFWTDIADANNDIKTEFDSGDGTHLNDDAHAILFNRVKNKHILSEIRPKPDGVDLAIVDFKVELLGSCGSEGWILHVTSINFGNESAMDDYQLDFTLNQSNGLMSVATVSNEGLASCEEEIIKIEYPFFQSQGINDGTYNTSVSLGYLGDINLENNVSESISFTILDPSLEIKNDTVCLNEDATLSVLSENVDHVFWYKDLIDPAPIGTGYEFNISELEFSQSYFAQGVIGDLFFKEELSSPSFHDKDWNGVMINLVPNEAIVIDSMLLKLSDLGVHPISVYTKIGSYIGFENDASAWSLFGRDTIAVEEVWSFHPINFGALSLIANDTVALYIHLDNPESRLAYADASEAKTFSSEHLDLITGTGISHTFQENYFPRTLPCKVFYHYGENFKGDCATERQQVLALISDLQVDLGPDLILSQDEMISLDAGSNFVSYQWNGVEGNQTLEIDASTLEVGTYIYEVIATDKFGCVSSDEIVIIIEEVNAINDFSKFNFQLNPNPNNGSFQLVLPFEGKFKLAVFNLQGMLIHETNGFGKEYSCSENFSDGVYFVKVVLEQMISHTKMRVSN